MCSFNDKEFAEFHQFLEEQFPFNDKTKTKKGLINAGKQPDELFWVLNPKVHVNSDGVAVSAEKSNYSWQPIGGPTIEFMGKDAVSMRLESLPLESTQCLRQLLEAVKLFFKHNFIAGE